MDNTITVNMENLSDEERKQLISLVEKSNQPKPKKRWRANHYEDYYTIFADGTIATQYEKNGILSNFKYKSGNYFKTKEETIFEREKRLVYQELKDYALEHNKDEIDWENVYQDKYCICFIHYDDNPNYQDVLYIDEMQRVEYPNTVYFTSKEIAQNAIDTIGEDRIKKYLFGII